MRGPGLGGDLRRGSKSPEQNMKTTHGCSRDTLAEQVRLVAPSWGAAGGTGHHPLPAPAVAGDGRSLAVSAELSDTGWAMLLFNPTLLLH